MTRSACVEKYGGDGNDLGCAFIAVSAGCMNAFQISAGYEPPTTGPHWRPESPMGRAWSLYIFSRYASAFRFLPARTRLYLVRKVLGPNGAWWLKEWVSGQIEVIRPQDGSDAVAQ